MCLIFKNIFTYKINTYTTQTIIIHINFLSKLNVFVYVTINL